MEHNSCSESSPNDSHQRNADIEPPPPPPLPLPGVCTQHKSPLKLSPVNSNLNNAVRKLVADHLEEVLRQSLRSELNGRETETSQCNKTVRRLVASLDFTSVVGCVVKERLGAKNIDNNEQKNDEPAILSFYRHVSPCIQRGPSCGVAALCMALNKIGHACDFDVALRVAQEMNFTKQGELFSAENVLSLACRLAPCEGRLLRKEDDIKGKGHQIIGELLANNVVLIPNPLLADNINVTYNFDKMLIRYDRDGNSEPCLKAGQKAHWACLTGVVLIENEKTRRQLTVDQTVSIVEDSELPYLHHVKLTADTFRSYMEWDEKTSFVYAMHGRSTHARLWRLDDVLKSNAQLTGLDPYILEDLPAFVVPVDGVKGGLCSQVIVLSKLFNSIS